MKSTYTVSSIGKFAGQALVWLRCLVMAIFALASFCAALLLPIASASVARKERSGFRDVDTPYNLKKSRHMPQRSLGPNGVVALGANPESASLLPGYSLDVRATLRKTMPKVLVSPISSCQANRFSVAAVSVATPCLAAPSQDTSINCFPANPTAPRFIAPGGF